ncbi:MAG: hypothetical protein N3F66_04135 [Spirochaetes bacterium]|nr:hypothetical protein [Spirochaetota bacterium]
MKILQLSIILFGILFLISPLYPSDLGLGISAWYADWKMYNPNEPISKTTKMDPVVYIGPSISYQFAPSWSTTLVALYTPSPYKMTNDYNETTEITRYDVDLALNYQLSRYIKVFVGAKYLGFNFDGGHHQGAGPGGGIGLTLPLISNFYFLANASGLYLWGNHKDPDKSRDFAEYGYNLSVQIAYYAASLGLTASLGYRYQLIASEYDTNDPYAKEDEHTFKGFTILIVKSFHWE